MKILSIRDDEMATRGELIEYPAELSGGRNLLPAFTSDKWGKPISVEPYRFTPRINTNDSITIGLELIRGCEYTLTFNTDHMRVYFNSYDENNNLTYLVNGRTNKHYTVIIPEDSSRQTISINTYSGNIGILRSAWNVKLEKGNKATDWTPAPEDLGLSYPDWVTEFKPSISENGILAPEFDDSGVLSFSTNRTTAQEFVENPNL